MSREISQKLRNEVAESCESKKQEGNKGVQTVEEIVSAAAKDQGVKLKRLAELAEMPYQVLQRSLRGLRELRIDEFLEVCRVLRLDPLRVCIEAGLWPEEQPGA